MDRLSLELFYTKLDIKRRECSLSWYEVAEQAGIGHGTRVRMAQGVVPGLGDLLKLVKWMNSNSV